MPTVVANNIGIKPYFTVNNPTYTSPKFITKTKLMLHSTATPGAPAQNFFPGWNKSTAGASVEFVLDDTQILQFMPIGSRGGANCYKTWHCGGSGNNLYVATEVCEPIQAQLIPVNYQTQGVNAKYKRTYSIQRIQMELKYLGYYDGSIDGSFGPKTEAAVKSFQKAKGMTADGIVGKATFYKLRERKGSYMEYDVVGATDFFNAAYNNAVTLFGFLCNYLGAKPSEIICHSEGYTKGLASNHADVTHWFPLHGKSMDDFRSDVAKYINGRYVPLGLGISPADQEYLDAVNKIHNAGIINTPDYWTNLVDATSVKNNYVMALLRQVGAHFCRMSHVYAVDAITNACNLNSPDMWKNSDSYSIGVVRCLYLAIARAETGDQTITDYKQAVQICRDVGIINSPDYWINLGDNDKPSTGCVRALLRQAGAHFCARSYVYGVDAIKYAINMNSEPYWKAGDYNVACTKALFKAIAKVI